MQTRRLGSDHEDKESTLARRQILIVIEDLRGRLDCGKPIKQFLYGVVIGLHVLRPLDRKFIAIHEQADRKLCRGCFDQARATHSASRARRIIKPPNA